MIILLAQMLQVVDFGTKDKCMNDLFRKESHYPNLSIVAMSQNLYHCKDPTLRRNSHYLVLLKTH